LELVLVPSPTPVYDAQSAVTAYPPDNPHASPLLRFYLKERVLTPLALDIEANDRVPNAGSIRGACHAAAAFTFIGIDAEAKQGWADGMLGGAVRFRYPSQVFQVTRAPTRFAMVDSAVWAIPLGPPKTFFRIELAIEPGTPFAAVKRAHRSWERDFPGGTEDSLIEGAFVSRAVLDGHRGYRIQGGTEGLNYQWIWVALDAARLLHVRVSDVAAPDVAMQDETQSAIAGRLIDSLRFVSPP